MVATDPSPKTTSGDLIVKYWPIVVGLVALLYAGIIRDDKAQRSATDFYDFAKEQRQINQSQAVTNARLLTIIEDQEKRLSRQEDKQK